MRDILYISCIGELVRIVFLSNNQMNSNTIRVGRLHHSDMMNQAHDIHESGAQSSLECVSVMHANHRGKNRLKISRQD